MTVQIPLTKGYTAIVDDADKDLADYKWTSHSRGYAYRQRSMGSKKQRTIFMHRVILERILGCELPPGMVCDHVNGTKTDNRRTNLRLASQQQNLGNKRQSKNNTSGYKGVSFNKPANKWNAKIRFDARLKDLGLYVDAVDAHRAYCVAALTHFGEFANFGQGSPFTGWTLADFEAPVMQLSLPLAA